MNERERFLAVCRGEKPDYVPIFGLPGAPGMSRGCMKKTHDRLVATGMPACVGGCWANWKCEDLESWYRYWGTASVITLTFAPAGGQIGFKETRRIEGGYEIIESESGALTRQVINNDITYSMPEFIRYPVRDRASWEFYKERMSVRTFMSKDEFETRCRALDDRTRPLLVHGGGSYSSVRNLMGPEGASFAFYDDPELVHEIIAWRLDQIRKTAFPLIERLRPDVVYFGEDLCYKSGMMLSPKHFEEFCAGYYREVCGLARSVGVPLRVVDTDGNAMEFTGIIERCGVNAICPYEVKAGNDLFELRRRHPEFVFFGWLEKEVANEGNEKLIRPEIMGKVPGLLETGRYFPNGDHGIQPLVTFPNLCRFMTLLHEVCGNPEGTFPRMDPP
ncbi:MAG: hypothetical protein N3A38_06595 [Planctomycetota bacterium]|nr:hypothetical protein [Planctomycetota bacterium]